QSSAWDSTLRSVNDVRLQVASSNDLAKIWNIGMSNPDELSEDDLVRFRLLLTSLVDATVMQYEQYTKLGMDSEYWTSTTITLKRFSSSPGFNWYWKNFGKETPEKFQSMLNELIQEESANET
ncbi:MAG: hypothetical protein RLP02_00805, partial [Coleofasciculus sp. C2-GNP5-27]